MKFSLQILLDLIVPGSCGSFGKLAVADIAVADVADSLGRWRSGA